MTRSRFKTDTRSKILLYLVALAMILVPFLFWRGTWFGRTLSDREMEEYLDPSSKPRRIQHALVQVSERIIRGEATTAHRWYGSINQLSSHPIAEVRVTVAWLMGQDNQFQPFHHALTNLVKDPNPLVRQNAALSLVRFGDDRGRPELLMMLRPHPIRAPSAGVLFHRLKEDDPVNPGTLMARIQAGGEEFVEVRSPVPGFLKSKLVGDRRVVSGGEEVLLLSPSEDQVWEALRALYLVGKLEDLTDIEPFTRRAPNMSVRIQQQARLTVDAIRQRSTPPG